MRRTAFVPLGTLRETVFDFSAILICTVLGFHCSLLCWTVVGIWVPKRRMKLRWAINPKAKRYIVENISINREISIQRDGYAVLDNPWWLL